MRNLVITTRAKPETTLISTQINSHSFSKGNIIPTAGFIRKAKRENLCSYLFINYSLHYHYLGFSVKSLILFTINPGRDNRPERKTYIERETKLEVLEGFLSLLVIRVVNCSE